MRYAILYYYNICILKNTITKEEKFLGKFGSEGTDDGESGTPSGVSFDNDDSLCVINKNNNLIQRLFTHGTFIIRRKSPTGDIGLNKSIDLYIHLCRQALQLDPDFNYSYYDLFCITKTLRLFLFVLQNCLLRMARIKTHIIILRINKNRIGE